MKPAPNRSDGPAVKKVSDDPDQLSVGTRYDRKRGFPVEVVELYGAKTCRVRIGGQEHVYTQAFVLRATCETPEEGRQMVMDV